MRVALDSPLEAQMEREADLQAELGRKRDFLEAMVALSEKRPPVFEGR
jgi:enoyl-CoA hydratase/carnithine racemase